MKSLMSNQMMDIQVADYCYLQWPPSLEITLWSVAPACSVISKLTSFPPLTLLQRLQSFVLLLREILLTESCFWALTGPWALCIERKPVWSSLLFYLQFLSPFLARRQWISFFFPGSVSTGTPVVMPSTVSATWGKINGCWAKQKRFPLPVRVAQ